MGDQNVIGNKSALNEGCDILVCTLGRLTHLIDSQEIQLDRLRTFVVDEADSTLCMSSENDPAKIIKIVGEQVICFHCIWTTYFQRNNGAKFRTVLLSSTFEPGHKFTSFLRPAMLTQIIVGIKNAPLPFVKQNFIFVVSFGLIV
jgi:superfamily II DNA/RNA helicase